MDNFRVCLKRKTLRSLLMLFLLLLTLLTFSLSKVRAQTGNQEEIHGSRAERVPGNISMDHRVS